MNDSYLDDDVIIQRFIEGRAHLAANEKLRVQSALDTEQLLARNGQILAIARLQETPPEVLVRKKSSYSQLMDRALQSSAFLPVRSNAPQGFSRYIYHTVPEGYQPHCAPARVLWRQWWLRHRQGRPSLVELDLALFTKGDWCPIRNIIFNHSTLFITTHWGETAHHGEDLVVWAEKKASTGQQERRLGVLRNRKTASSVLGSKGKPGPISSSQVSGIPAIPATLQQVVRQEAGKLYIQTAVGEVVIEGTDLRCGLTTLSP